MTVVNKAQRQSMVNSIPKPLYVPDTGRERVWPFILILLGIFATCLLMRSCC